MNRDLLSEFDNSRWKVSQRRIGLTGGIASGKSSVAYFLEERVGLTILDADFFSRKALGPGTPLTKRVVARYGKDVLDPTKSNSLTLDRFALAQIIFSDTEERLWLEGLVHPFVRNCFDSELSKVDNHKVVVLMVPLLFEVDFVDLCSEVWLVTCNIDQQVKRLSKRDGISLEQAQTRIKTQWPMERKEKLADFVIDNHGPPKSWVPEVLSLVNSDL